MIIQNPNIFQKIVFILHTKIQLVYIIYGLISTDTTILYTWMILYFLLVMQWRYLNGCVLHYLETGTRHGILTIWISRICKKDLQTIFKTGNHIAFYLALFVCCKIAAIKLNLSICSDSTKDECITGESSWLHVVMCKTTTL